ncbi:MAG: zinc ABC transporter substrate-binding protein [Pseudomonadota bacterium]
MFRRNAAAAIRPLGAVAIALAILGTRPAAAETPEVVVSIKPIHALVAGLLDGIAKPALLVDGAASPHTYALKPSDGRALDRAHIFVRIGDSVDPFARKLVTGLDRKVTVVTVQDIPGMTLKTIRTGAAFEAHDHDDDHGHGAKKGHDHDKHSGKSTTKAKAKDHDHDHDGAVDGHVWLDPANARLIVAHLQDLLAKRYPDHATRVAENAGKLTARLGELESGLGRRMRALAGRPFVVFHDGYQYFEARFGLTAAGAITANPEVPPGAKRISELRKRIGDLGARCVFAEPQFRAKVVNSIIEGTKAKAGVLDPIGAEIASGPELYFTMMGNLAASFESCLADPS